MIGADLQARHHLATIRQRLTLPQKAVQPSPLKKRKKPAEELCRQKVHQEIREVL